MSEGSPPGMNYTRQSLRKATKFVEGDYKGINPRQFYRSLKRSLEEIQEGGGFKYTTRGTQESDLSIESEQVGEKTGRVKGRLVAASESREVGKGTIEYKPYGPHGALAITVGGLLFLIGLAGESMIALLGLIALIGGGYLYFQKETGEIPVQREDVIRVLMTGEVSERTIEDGDETRTDIFANMSVIYAGDALLNVSLDDFDQMEWTFRREIVKQVKRWYNKVVEDESNQETVSAGFMENFSAWANRSASSDRQTVARCQSTINGEFDMRIQYSEILMDRLPNEVRDELSEHQDSLLEELESLSEDMDIYVEREGLQRVS